MLDVKTMINYYAYLIRNLHKEDEYCIYVESVIEYLNLLLDSNITEINPKHLMEI